ncbi:MAG: hypothetical protein WDN02_01860 [Methylovirgula sp.]|uniref:hypothetical protein n=1 Tax=Methylovirgula sp. TaxID=1978224 RepID=UPI0030763C68
MPNNTVPAAATGLPFAHLGEPAFELTDAGRAYLLLEDIADAAIVLPCEIAAELATLTAGGQANV